MSGLMLPLDIFVRAIGVDRSVPLAVFLGPGTSSDSAGTVQLLRASAYLQ